MRGPLLIASLGALEGVRLAATLSLALALALNVVLLVRHHDEVDHRGALLLFVPTALALPGFAIVARGLPDRPAQAAGGTVVLVGTALLASGARWPAARGRVGAVAAGVVAAATTVVSSVGGPPVALWAANTGRSADVQRATLQAYFLGVNLVALPALGLPRTRGTVILLCLLGLAAGVLLGAPLGRRLGETAARRGTLLLAGAGGTVVLLRALLG